jgi:hypothetical protein
VKDEDPPASPRDFDRGWDEPRRRQARLGRDLTHAERLRWLSEAVAGMRRLQGRANARTDDEGTPGKETP